MLLPEFCIQIPLDEIQGQITAIDLGLLWLLK
jgi:hypothetical protein